MPEPLCILLPVPCNFSSDQADSGNQSEDAEKTNASFMGQMSKKWEEEESPVSFFMECPESVMSGVVLLVSPSGEIALPGYMNSQNDLHPQIAGGNSFPTSSFMVSNGVKEPESSVSSFMDESKPIMDGLVLLASASGVITFDEVMSSHDYPHCLGFATSVLTWVNDTSSENVKPGLSYTDITNETVRRCGENAQECDTGEPIMLNESCLGPDGDFYICHPHESSGMSEVESYTVSVVDASDKDIDNSVIISSESSKPDGIDVDGEAKVISNNFVGSSIQSRKRKRLGKLSHESERNEVKDGTIDESNIALRCLIHKRKRRKPKMWLDCPEYRQNETEDICNKPIDDLRIDIPFETALSAEAEKETVMKQILDILRGAGWIVRWRITSRGKSSKSKERVFLNPEGRVFRSVGKAYKALQHDLLDGKVGSYCDKGKLEKLVNVKVSLETALSVGDMESIRKQVEGMLLGAGWKVECRSMKRVYLSPEGEVYESFTKAYVVLQEEVVEGKGKLKPGKAYLDSIRNLVVDVLLRTGWTVEHRRCKGSAYTRPVYVNLEGKSHWSINEAYRALQQEGGVVREKVMSCKV